MRKGQEKTYDRVSKLRSASRSEGRVRFDEDAIVVVPLYEAKLSAVEVQLDLVNRGLDLRLCTSKVVSETNSDMYLDGQQLVSRRARQIRNEGE